MSLSAEPGRHVAESGRIVYAWPPVGRFAALWRRLEAALPSDHDKTEAVALLTLWQFETSTLVAYEDDDDEWVDVEPDWDVPGGWLEPGGP